MVLKLPLVPVPGTVCLPHAVVTVSLDSALAATLAANLMRRRKPMDVNVGACVR